MKKSLCLVALLIACYYNPTKAQLLINELMASNETTIANELGEYEDWIEIYNAGTSDIDLGGYYISDDPMLPTLWQIPTTNASLTTVPAQGFLLLWADKNVMAGALHLDIKLGSGGEALLLVDPDGVTIVDQVTFGPQSTDVSYGRTNDGEANFQQFTNPTPNAPNDASTASNLTYQISVSSATQTIGDDALQLGVDRGSVYLEHYGLTIGEDWTETMTGVRFDNITLPQGATVKSAYIQFTSLKPDDSMGDADFDIKGELTADAAPFEEERSNLSDRRKTNSTVSWQPEEWIIKEDAGPKHRTSNIASLLEEIVAQDDWESGNAMAFMITGTGNRSAQNLRTEYQIMIDITAEAPAPSNAIDNIYINEVCANGTDFADERGGYRDWIELYNTNNTAIALGGLYLTDDIDNLTKWQIASSTPIPANGFLTIFADGAPHRGGLHADFQLSGSGETLALVQAINNELVIIDSLTYGNVPFKTSFGRYPDASDNIELFGVPSPEASNDNTLAWLPKPDISLDHGVFTTAQEVTLSHIDPSVTIYYTTNGSYPDDDEEMYNGESIIVNKTQSVRAVAYKDGHAPSQVRTRNYMFDPSNKMPMVMITTDPDNLFSDETGIYVIGTNGIQYGNCKENPPANYWQPWERPVTISMFESTGEEAFTADMGIQISGNCSRRYALKSFNLYFRNNRYGDKDLGYQLFPERDFKKYKRLRLRSSGQDYRSTRMRDGTNQEILSGITDVEYQSYRPAVVYINGEYWGIMNFRNLYGGDYFDNFFDVKEENLDLVRTPRLSNIVKEGSDAHYNELFSFVTQNGLSDPANYEYFTTQLDINNFLDYWISMTYMSSGDWPANNVQVWRPRTPDGKWRYMYVDTDATTNHYGDDSTTGHTYDTFSEILNENASGWPFDARSTLFLRNLLENEVFYNEFVQRASSIAQIVISEERALSFVDKNAAFIDGDVGPSVERWAFDNEYLENYEDWAKNITKYRRFFIERPAYFFEHMENNLGLGGIFQLSFNYNETTNGDVFLHWGDLQVPYNYTGSYYRDIPIRITAKAKEGYQFSHWEETGETSAVIDFEANSNQTLTPIFELVEGVCDPSSPNFLDDDGDGVCNEEDQCPGFMDSIDIDNDGIPDGCEECIDVVGDSDGDGVCDTEDQCPGFDDAIDTNNNNIPDGCEDCVDLVGDEDGDGVCDTEDICPGGDDTVDFDNDGIPDFCDDCLAGDDDGDGICNDLDQCPGGDDTVDVDDDGIPDFCDDCITAGIACDDGDSCTTGDVYDENCNCVGVFTDTDNDTVCDANDQCPGGDDNEDVDNDTIPDACDDCVGTDVDGDGVCSDEDCDDLNPNIPAEEGTVCDDGDQQTIDDEIQEDGCTCEGEDFVQTGDEYCESEGNFAFFEWIAKVELNDLINSSQQSKYTDYTNLTVNLEMGARYDINLSAGFAFATPDQYFNVWIDYNQDRIFEDTELAFSGILTGVSPGTPTGDISGIINIPTDAEEGTTRMRVSMQSGAYPSPCGTFPLGEVEDYSVNLMEPETFLTLNNCEPFIRATPEPGQTSMIIEWAEPTANTTCTANTNGTNNSVSIQQTEGPPSGSSFSIGNTSISYTITDECDNEETCSFLVIINNPNNGSIDLACPQDIVLTANIGQNGATISWTEPRVFTTCANGGLNIEQTEGLANGAFFPIGNTEVTYMATDLCGNEEACTFLVSVAAPDSGELTFDCIDDFTVLVPPGQSTIEFTFADPVASTTCSIGGLEVIQIEGITNGSSFPIGTHELVYEASDACGNLETCSFDIIIVAQSSADYCEPDSDFPYRDWIGRVQYNTIDNTSGKDGYGDYTDINTILLVGQAYDFTFTTAYSYTVYDEYWKAWIDYNQDGIFQNPEELAFSTLQPAPPPETDSMSVQGSITIPISSFLGETRMRISMSREADALPCDILNFGEVEDYTLVLTNIAQSVEATSTPETEKEQITFSEMIPVEKEILTLFPNPTRGELYIEAKNFAGTETSILIYNHLGQVVKQNNKRKFPDSKFLLEIDHQPTGLYYLVLKSEGKIIASKKFTIHNY